MQATTDLLNAALELEYRSLPRYLAQVSPWVPPAGRPAVEFLKRVARRQEKLAQKLSDAILALRGVPEPGDYPIEYARYHFLSLAYLRPIVLDSQRSVIARLGEIVAGLAHDATGRSLVEEALGSEKAHLEQLEELLPKA